MALARLKAAEVDMDDARALVAGAPGFARHLLRRHRRWIDGGIGQDAGQRAGDDRLVHLNGLRAAQWRTGSPAPAPGRRRTAFAVWTTPSIGARIEYCIFIASTVASTCPRRTLSPALASTPTMTPLTGERTAPSESSSLSRGGA